MKNPTHTRERMHQGQVSWYRLGSGEALIGYAGGKLLPLMQALKKLGRFFVTKNQETQLPALPLQCTPSSTASG